MSTKRRVLTLLLAMALVFNMVFAMGISVAATDTSTAPALDIGYCNLSFRDSVCITYYVPANDGVKVKLLVWDSVPTSFEFGTQSMILESVGTRTIGETTYEVFENDSLVAKQMTDVVYARAYAEVGGNAYYGKANKYSILQYAYNKLGKLDAEASEDENLKFMLTSMLKYGASAQKYFKYRTDSLANADFYQVKLTAGTLDDGFEKGLYVEGAKVNVTAPATDAEGRAFSCWGDSKGNKVATSASATLTVGNKNEVYTPYYGDDEPTVPVDPDAEKKVFDETKIVLSFAALSDIHVGNAKANADGGAYFQNALAQLMDYAKKHDADGLDAVIGAGDLTETYSTAASSKYPEIATLKSLYDSSAAKDVPFIYALGNHDHDFQRGGGAGVDLATFIELMGNQTLHTKYDNSCSDSVNGSRHATIGNYHFLFVEPQTYSCSGADATGAKYADETLSWLDSTLANITKTNPSAYVFVITHAMIYDTVYGSDLLTSGIYWYTKQLDTVLAKYPQVVTFGGHLHFPLNDPRSIMQDHYTSLGCGSVNYMAIEAGGYDDMASATTMKDRNEFSQGLLVQLDENGNIRITRMDFHHKTTIGDAWEISYPTADKAHLETYSKDRGNEKNNEAPVLSEIKAELGKLDTSAKKQDVTITFAAATDDEFAHHYELVVTAKATGNQVASCKILSDFYCHGDVAGMKKTYSKTFNLTAGTEYEVTITAYDSWGAKGTKTCTFKLEGEAPEAVKSELYADIDFKDGKIIDTKGNVSFTNNAHVEKAEVKHGEKTATLDAFVIKQSQEHAIGVFDKLQTSADFKAFAEKGFSAEAFYVMPIKGTSAANKIQGVFCATEYGGWGIAENQGTPYCLSASAKNTYQTAYAKAASSTTELVHVVEVYDPANGKQYIYINGVLNTETKIAATFYPGEGEAYNKFALGHDIYSDGKVATSAYPTPAMTMVDAKFYTGALTANEVKEAYDKAVAMLDVTTPEEPEEPEQPEAPKAELYADIDFKDGKIIDTKGNISFTNNAHVEKAEVKHGEKTATLDAFVVKKSQEHAIGVFDKLQTSADFKAFAEKGFSAEAFYVMPQKGGVQGVFCATEAGGWGIAETAGKPYCLSATLTSKGNQYQTAYAKAVSSTTELVHVVEVYDPANGKQYIYINGVLNAETEIVATFNPGAGEAYNKFALGHDIYKTGGVETKNYPTPAMTMVDAKFYSGALTAEEVQTAYANAVSLLG